MMKMISPLESQNSWNSVSTVMPTQFTMETWKMKVRTLTITVCNTKILVQSLSAVSSTRGGADFVTGTSSNLWTLSGDITESKLLSTSPGWGFSPTCWSFPASPGFLSSFSVSSGRTFPVAPAMEFFSGDWIYYFKITLVFVPCPVYWFSLLENNLTLFRERQYLNTPGHWYIIIISGSRGRNI